MQFSAFSIVHQFAVAIKNDGPESSLPATQTMTIEPEAEAGAARAVAFTNLSLVMNSKQLVKLLVGGQTTDWTSGLARKVVKALVRRFKPNDFVSKIQLCQMLNQISMQKCEDAVALYEQLSKVSNQFNMVINNDDAIGVLMDAAPVEYQSGLDAEQRSKGDSIMIQHLADSMDQQWRSLYGNISSKQISRDNRNKIVLGAV